MLEPQLDQAPVVSVVLVVDDLQDNLDAMQELLEDPHRAIHCVDNAVAALAFLQHHEVDLILLDVQMPDMDGFEFAKRLREQPKTLLTPIIFLSGLDQTDAVLARGYATGAIDFIKKPFDPVVLNHKVTVLLALERQRRELSALTQQLESARAFNASILENAAEGIMVVSDQGEVRYANPAIATMLQCSLHEVLGSQVLDFLQAAPVTGTWQASDYYQRWMNGETYCVHDAVLYASNAQTLPVALSCSPIPAQQAMVFMALDMSVTNSLHEQLESLALSDALTGLLNRRGFLQAMESALSRRERSGKGLAVLYMDLDGFKRVNDLLGHDAGDVLLCQVAQQLRECIRSYDTLGRMGGDEFTLLLDSLSRPEDAQRVATKLIGVVSGRRNLNGFDFNLGVSIGIAYLPEEGMSIEALLGAADMAMYEAKRGGRRQYRIYTEEMRGRESSKRAFEDQLRSAVSQQQFSLCYQPQVDLVTGELRGFEALLRLGQADNRWSPAAEFIQVLEDTRLLNELNLWIFRHAAEMRQSLVGKVADSVRVSINISALQFGLKGLVDELSLALREFGLKPGQLELEVSEAALMQNLTHSREQLKRLRALGVKTAFDGFGRGQFSLADLRYLELDCLKIDRQFICAMLESQADGAMVKSIIALGHNLGLEVIATGVESKAQRDWLVLNQCDALQGYLIAAELRPEEVRLSWGNRSVELQPVD
ncbi:putative bifunctional diguanylate cyclase/phosphodiesterase [Pseudomonas sp. RL_15y_Pfl2_60]